MEIIGTLSLYIGVIALLVAAIAWILKNPEKLPTKKTAARLSIGLLLCTITVLSIVWVYATYFRPIHRYYHGDYGTLLVKAEFYPSGNCVISLMDRTDPKLTVYMYFGGYARVGHRLKVSWNTMSRRSEFELRGDSLYLPGGSCPHINQPLTLATNTINLPRPGDLEPLPVNF